MQITRTSLLSSTILGAAALVSFIPAAAFAQDTPPEEAPVAVGELIVTGTRLRLPDFVATNPVQSAGEGEIVASGDANLTEFLRDIPSLVGSQDLASGAEYDTPTQAGLNLLELRNLKPERTLVLVNGRRHVAADPGTAAVDINTIPTDLIKRVDILTGGASALYGSDGVTGVVNFILKDDYDGASVRVQHGFSEDGGGDETFASLLLGKNFLEGRGNITFGFEYDRLKDLKFRDRSYTTPGNRFIITQNPNDPGSFDKADDDPDIFDNILTNDARYFDTSMAGSVMTNLATSSIAGFNFLGDGSPFVDGVWTGDFISIGGSGSLLDEYNDDLLPGLERFNGNLLGKFDLTDKIQLFGELKMVRTKADFEGQPSYEYGQFIPIDNPYIPANIVADFYDAQLTGDDPGTVFGLPDGVLVGRDHFDLGRTSVDITRRTFRSVFGARGDLTDNLRYEASYVYGEAEQKLHFDNVRINERYYAATDVVMGPNGPVCRSDLDPSAIPIADIFAQFYFDGSNWGTTFTPGAGSGCVPTNIFGENQITQASRDWINTEVTDRAKIKQSVFNAYLSGDTDGQFTFPGGGPLYFAVGGEWRKEKSDFQPDPIEILADQLEYPITTAGRASITKGEFDVTEGFVELSLPLMLDKPFVKDLTVSGAYRLSDYSSTGKAETWNTGLKWRPNDQLMFRGTLARAVRAPNIVNLYQGRQQVFAEFADPCSQGNLGGGENPTQRAANCAIDIAAVGEDPNTYVDVSSEAVGGFIRGNTNLKPEKADTWTVGAVFTPAFIPGLQVSVDWYNIEIANSIQSYDPQTIINNCYDLPRPNDFCALISRQGAADPFPGRINGFDQIPGNIASYETAGLDFSIRYTLNPARFGIERDIGIYRFTVLGNRLDRLVFIESSGAIPDDDFQEEDAPEWQVTLDLGWEYKNLSVNYGYSYFSETRRVSAVTQAAEPDYIDPKYFWYKARSEHDIRAEYHIKEKYSVYGGVNNLFNQLPEFDDYTYPVSPTGRFFYLGVKASL